MTLERLADGSHRFTPPTAPYIAAQDAFGRTAGIGALGTRPIGPAHFTPPQLVKDHGMQGYELMAFQVEFYDARNTWQQEGPLSEVHAGYEDNEMVGDAPFVMRHPFAVGEEPATSGSWVNPANSGTILTRMVWAYFLETLYATMGIVGTPTATAPVVYKETSVTNAVMTKVTSYAPNAGSKQILCMAVIQLNTGTSYLFIGYGSIAGTALGCEAFATADLATPIQVDASNGHVGTGNLISGIIQAPNGDVIAANTAGDVLLATDNTAAPAALSFTRTLTQALGYYPVAVGKCALANYAPGALWWCSNNNTGALPHQIANNNNNDLTPQGHLVLMSYDGGITSLDPIDFPDLDYVTFPTIYRGGVVACDREAHYWYTGRDMISMDGGADRPVNSHKTRLCCGHAVVGDKLVRIEAEIDDRFDTTAPLAAYNTVARVIEYDPYLKRERPISKAIDLGFGGQSLVVGATPSLPFSPNTRNIHWFSIWEGLLSTRNQDFGRWWRQYQKANNKQGFAERSTDADTSGGAPGFEGYDDDVTYTSAHFTHPALQGFEYTPMRAIFPRVESLQAGGEDARVDIAIGGYNDTVHADEPEHKYPAVEFGDWPGRTWSTALQAVLTSHLGTGVTHKTQNVFPLTIEVLARRPIQDGIKLA